MTFNKLWWLRHEINLIIVSPTNYEIPLLLLMVLGDQDMDWVAICGKGQHYFWPLGHCLEEQASRRFGQKPYLGVCVEQNCLGIFSYTFYALSPICPEIHHLGDSVFQQT